MAPERPPDVLVEAHQAVPAGPGRATRFRSSTNKPQPVFQGSGFARRQDGGGGGIRTLGRGVAPTTVFETAPFNHSGTPPRRAMGVRSSIGERRTRRRGAVVRGSRTTRFAEEDEHVRAQVLLPRGTHRRPQRPARHRVLGHGAHDRGRIAVVPFSAVRADAPKMR